MQKLFKMAMVEEQIRFGTDAGLKVEDDKSIPFSRYVVFLDPVTGNLVMSVSETDDPLPRVE